MTTDETIALIIVAFIAAVFILYRRWYNRQRKIYVASDEVIGGYRLRIVEHNPRTNDAEVLVNIFHPSKKPHIEALAIEFIDQKRNFEVISLNDLLAEVVPLKFTEDERAAGVRFYKSDFLKAIRNHEIKLYRFRFVWLMNNGTKLKTREMAISVKYIFFKPDTGFFN
jgi:hypothetical protein